MESLLRIISWTLVVGALSALAYAGLKPVLNDIGFPPVDESQVGGAMLATAEDAEKVTPPSDDAVNCDAAGNRVADCEPHSP